MKINESFVNKILTDKKNKKVAWKGIKISFFLIALNKVKHDLYKMSNLKQWKRQTWLIVWGFKWKTVLTASLFHIELQQFFPFNPDITSKHLFEIYILRFFFIWNNWILLSRITK